MSQMGNVNILDAISPAAAGNAREGATANAQRITDVQKQDQASLLEGVKLFNDSVHQTADRAMQYKMHRESLSHDAQMKQMEIEAKLKEQGINISAEQAAAAKQRSFEADMQGLQNQRMTDMNTAMLQLQYAHEDGGTPNTTNAPAGTSPTGGAAPDPSSQPAPGSGVTAPAQQGSSWESLTAPPAPIPPLTSQVRPLTTSANTQNYLQAQSLATEAAARLSAGTLLAATAQQNAGEITSVWDQKFAQIADMAATREQVKAQHVNDAALAMQKVERAATSKDERSFLGKELAYQASQNTLAGNVGRSALRGVKGLFVDVGAPTPEKDRAVSDNVTSKYLADLAYNYAASDTKAKPEDGKIYKVQGDLTDVLRDLHAMAMADGGNPLPGMSRSELEDHAKAAMANLNKSGVSAADVHDLVEHVSTTANYQKGMFGDVAGMKGDEVTPYLNDHLASILPKFTKTFGTPQEDVYSPLKDHLAAMTAMLRGANTPEEAVKQVDNWNLDPRTKSHVQASLKEYFGLGPVQERIKTAAKAKELQTTALEANVGLAKAAAASVPPELRRQEDLVTRTKARIGNTLSVLRDQNDLYNKKQQEIMAKYGMQAGGAPR